MDGAQNFDETNSIIEIPESGDQYFQEQDFMPISAYKTVTVVETILDLSKNDFVAANMLESWWIGKVEQLLVIKNEAEINFMHPLENSRSRYCWPEYADKLPIKVDDVLCKLKNPPVSKRGKKQTSDFELDDACLDEIESVFLSKICGHQLAMSAY